MSMKQSVNCPPAEMYTPISLHQLAVLQPAKDAQTSESQLAHQDQSG